MNKAGMFAGLVFLAGCAVETAPEPTAPTAGRAAEAPTPLAPPHSVAADLRGPEAFGQEASVYEVRRPTSRIVPGARVTLWGAGLQVTAASHDTVWVQEAGDSGACEIGDGAVAFRAIAVRLRAPSGARPAPGQRVVVRGSVAELEGRRVIAEASLELVGAPVRPYAPHCERNARALDTDALDGVLVRTAGTTEGEGAPIEDGSWSLSTCFPAGTAVTVGSKMTAYTTWSSTWHWVTGVASRSFDGVRIDPRDAEDIQGHHGNDACL